MHPWEWPIRPWSRIHIDHAGPFIGKIFFVLVDAHSKWMDAHIVSSASSGNVISVLKSVFATHGLSETVVSDNGTAFASAEFRAFLKRNGIKQITSAPYHPSTNGLAERAVQTLKNALRKANSKDITANLARFLFHYRTTPHSTTGLTPAEMLMGRTLRTHLDHIKPDVAAKVQSAQEAQSEIMKRSVDIQVMPESSAADPGLPQFPSNNTSNPEADSESDQSSSQPQPLRRSACI